MLKHKHLIVRSEVNNPPNNGDQIMDGAKKKKKKKKKKKNNRDYGAENNGALMGNIVIYKTMGYNLHNNNGN